MEPSDSSCIVIQMLAIHQILILSLNEVGASISRFVNGWQKQMWNSILLYIKGLYKTLDAHLRHRNKSVMNRDT